MNCWIVMYSHAHGTGVWPRFQKKPPTESEEAAELMDWEPNKGETLEIVGPFKVPRPKKQKKGLSAKESAHICCANYPNCDAAGCGSDTDVGHRG
jgi:hypothetical protein